MQNDFVIELIATNKHTAVFFAAGAINTETSSHLYHYVEDIIRNNNPRSIVFDVGKVPYISSSGVGVLMQILEEILELQGVIILVNAHESITRILSVLGFTRYFLYASSMEEAHHILLSHFAHEEGKIIA